MNEIVRHAVLNDQAIANIQPKFTTQNDTCRFCDCKLDQKDFEVLTYFSTYIFLCRECVHGILNHVVGWQKELRMKQHSVGSQRKCVEREWDENGSVVK